MNDSDEEAVDDARDSPAGIENSRARADAVSPTEDQGAEMLEPHSLHETSSTLADDSELVADSQNKHPSQQVYSTVPTSAAEHIMSGPPKSTNTGPPQQNPPRSGQGSQPTANLPARGQDAVSEEDQRNLTSQGSNQDTAMQDDERLSQSSAIGDPQDELHAFDWEGLEKSYHDQMGAFSGAERAIMADFEGLCQSFAIWAAAGSNREADRTFKRLKTQMCFVQQNEEELEKKRQHYIKVVDAFKSALQLLEG